MAAPTFVSSTLTEEPVFVTAYTLTIPTTPAPTIGNILIAIVTSATVTATPIFTLSGWTPINEVGNNGANTCECATGVWWREVTGSETSTYEITSTGNSAKGWTDCIEISGADTTTPINQSNFSETTGGGVATITNPAITTGVDDCYCIAAFALESGAEGPYTTSGTGWTELENDTTDTSGSGNGITVATKTVATAGTTEDCISTPTSNAQAAYFQIAIAPAAGGATNPKGPLGLPLNGPFGGPV